MTDTCSRYSGPSWGRGRCGRPLGTDKATGEKLAVCNIHAAADRRKEANTQKWKAEQAATDERAKTRQESTVHLKELLKAAGIGATWRGESAYSFSDSGHALTIHSDHFSTLEQILQAYLDVIR